MKKLFAFAAFALMMNQLNGQCQWQFGVSANALTTTGLRKEYLGSTALHTPMTSYNMGLIAAQQFKNRHWMFSSGLQYGYFQHQTTILNFQWGSQHDGQGGFDPNIDPGEELRGTTYVYTHHYLGMPLTLRYNFTTGPWRLYASQGIIGRITLRSEETISPDFNNIAQEEWIARRKAFTLVAQTGLGLERRFGRDKFFFAEPNMMIGRGPEDSYFSYGVALGLRVVYR